MSISNEDFVYYSSTIYKAYYKEKLIVRKENHHRNASDLNKAAKDSK